MEYLFKDPEELDPDQEDLEFQIIDLYVPESDKAERELNKGQYNYDDEPKVYDIYLFGKTAKGDSVCAKVTGFEPYFFVKPPASWGKNIKQRVAELRNTLLEEQIYNPKTQRSRNIIPRALKSHFSYIKTVMRKDFWGFTNGKEFPFMKLKVKSLALFNMLKRYFQDRSKDGFQLYESNIEPFLRFLHERDIQPCGWVRLPAGTYDWAPEDESGDAVSRAAYNVEIDYNDVHGIEINRIAPLKIMSFDLECTSSHGDFPVPKKNYRKLAMDLVAAAKASPIPPTSDDIKQWICGAFMEERTLPTGATIHKVYPKNKINTASILKRITSDLDELTELTINAAKSKKKKSADAEPDEDAEPVETPDESELALVVQLSEILPQLQGDPIIQIGTTVHIFGSDQIAFKHIATLKSCEPIDGTEVECFDTEEELIEGWKDVLKRVDPDVITGYNIFGFDMDYIWKRVQELHIEESFGLGLGRLNNRRTTLLEQRLASSALGDNILRYIDTDGVVPIDVFKVMQRDQKLDSYKLDHVAQVFLGDKKDDLKPKEIFEKFKGSAADRCVIAKYCIQDCALVNRLMHKLKVLENNIGMGNVCSVPLSYLFMRGQGVKIFSLVAKECRAKQYVIPVLKSPYAEREEDDPPVDESGYEGAIVLEPKEGIYLQDPITVLDYSSLYPSSMIARNLSHDCFVNDPAYANLESEGITYITVKYDVYEGVGDKKRAVDTKECTFAQLPDNKKGIIPSILMKLLQQRKNTRKKIEYERITLNDGRVAIGLTKDLGNDKLEILNVDQADLGQGFGGHKAVIDAATIVSREPAFTSFEQAVLDALQLAFKVTANSLYGQIGSRTSQIYWKDIAACTTATGREMIMLATRFAEEKYGAEVVYGDSVTGDTPLLIKYDNGLVDVKTIETMSNEWIEYENFRPWDENAKEKEQAAFNGCVWSNGKWARIIRVIRHKVNKKMYRVNTFQGCVDVTADHSIMSASGEEIKPMDCVINETDIMHSYPDEFLEENVPRTLTKEEAWVMGLFFGDGECSKQSWAIDNTNLEYLNRAKRYIEMVEPKDVVVEAKILDTMDFKLVICGSMDYMVTKYRGLFYNKDNFKCVPRIILNAPKEIKEWFIQGYLTTDSSKYHMSCGEANFACQGKIGSMGLYYLIRAIGYKQVRVNIQEYNDNTYWISTIVDSDYYEKNHNKVMKIQELPEVSEDTFVYDIETSEGVFNGGVGSIICKNTDSCFLRFKNYDETGKRVYGKEALPIAIANGQKMSREIKPLMPPPQSLEYEKTFYPFIIFSKKRYVGNLYEDDANKKPKQKSMGIVLKRRDNAPIVKHIYGGILDIILNKNDLHGSVQFLQDELQKLVDGKFPLEDLVITKTLKSDYKDPTKIAHKVLADRMGMRDPGNKPASNDRIPFVYICPPPDVEVKLQGDRIEHPDYIREHNLKPDYKFYITNQLMTPICQLYGLCVEDIPNYTYPPEYWEQIDEELKDHRLYTDPKKRKDRITALRMKEVVELLFEPFLSKLEDVMPKKRATATRKNKTLSPVDATMPVLRIDVKENKEKKAYECSATLTDPTKNDATLYEHLNLIPKKQKVTSKQYAFRITAEKCLQELHKTKVTTNMIRVHIEDKTFARTWKNALETAADMRNAIQDALSNKDVGLMKELQERFTFLHLVDAMDAIPYTLSS